MLINELRINGVSNPVGFSYEKILCSWKVTDTSAKKQRDVRIEIAADFDFQNILEVALGSDLQCNGTEIQIKLKPYTTYYWRVTVEGDNGEKTTSESASFETGKMDEPWIAKWIGSKKEDVFHPVLLKKFHTDKKIKQARIYSCGLGVYEAYLNNKKIGNDYLAPFLNDYKEAYQYETYDITNLIQKENEVRIYLGKGWYMGTFGLNLKDKIFGDEMMAIAEIRLEYEDGSAEVIPTDESWQYQGSDIEESGIYFGEILNRELWKNKKNPVKNVEIKEQKIRLTERFSIPVIVKEEIDPIEIIHTPAGETVIDMGQNFAGYMEFNADFAAGTKVTFECGEILQQNNFYHDNYRDAESVFIYISDGRKEVVRPHFTYFGFRYLRVTGWPGELKLSDVKGKVVYSDLERTGYIETSNAKINCLYENCIWGQKSNFIDLPTDCPQRSERLGWTGDAQVFAPTASYNMDTRAFYHKFMRDLRSEQLRCNGGVPNFIPNVDALGGACSVWGDAATFLPDDIYKMFGCLEEVRPYYTLMRDWVEYMSGVDEAQGKHNLFRPGFQFGDWLALDGITEQSFKGSTDDDYIGSVYYYQSAKMTAEMAERLGEKSDAKKYKELTANIKNAVLNEYFTPTGRLAMDTQASYIIALKFGLFSDKEKLLTGFKERLKKDCYQIKCGFVGAPLLCTTLCENGMEDLAYHFLFNEGFPSWLYSVNLGATTIWERWNSVLADGTISGTGMNSLNHYSYGSVVQFFYEYIAGIRTLEPGFKHVIIAPLPSMKFRYFNCSYNSVYGKYVSNWKIAENGHFTLYVEIPFNCKADVVLPRYAASEAKVFAAEKTGEALKDVSGILSITEDGKVTLDSGVYEFCYIPSKDYRMIYDNTTRLGEVCQDTEVMAILQKDLPQAYGIIMTQDKENLNLTFGELGYMFFMGFTPEMVERATEPIFKLIRY